MPIRIETLIDAGLDCSVEQSKLADAAIAAASSRGFHTGEIGIRLTDDLGIHQINRQHLQHDFPTDVISFGYRADRPEIEGELVVSVDTAARCAVEMGWPLENELMLYVVHGTLHLSGMDDRCAEERLAMRAAESGVLANLGIAGLDRYGADCFAANETEGDA